MCKLPTPVNTGLVSSAALENDYGREGIASAGGNTWAFYINEWITKGPCSVIPPKPCRKKKDGKSLKK